MKRTFWSKVAILVVIVALLILALAKIPSAETEAEFQLRLKKHQTELAVLTEKINPLSNGITLFLEGPYGHKEQCFIFFEETNDDFVLVYLSSDRSSTGEEHRADRISIQSSQSSSEGLSFTNIHIGREFTTYRDKQKRLGIVKAEGHICFELANDEFLFLVVKPHDPGKIFVFDFFIRQKRDTEPTLFYDRSPEAINCNKVAIKDDQLIFSSYFNSPNVIRPIEVSGEINALACEEEILTFVYDIQGNFIINGTEKGVVFGPYSENDENYLGLWGPCQFVKKILWLSGSWKITDNQGKLWVYKPFLVDDKEWQFLRLPKEGTDLGNCTGNRLHVSSAKHNPNEKLLSLDQEAAAVFQLK